MLSSLCAISDETKETETTTPLFDVKWQQQATRKCEEKLAGVNQPQLALTVTYRFYQHTSQWSIS